MAEIFFPCLITVEKGIYEPRLPSYRLKLATQSTPIQTLTLDDLPGVDPAGVGLNGSPTRVIRVFPPESSTTSETITGSPDGIADRLLDVLIQKKLLNKTEGAYGRDHHSS